jgi:hypothetical protein
VDYREIVCRCIWVRDTGGFERCVSSCVILEGGTWSTPFLRHLGAGRGKGRE